MKKRGFVTSVYF